MDASAHIICMSTLHQWGTLNKASPASPAASRGWDAGCTGVVQRHTAPATLSPALSGTPTQQDPALETLQGNLLHWVSRGDSSLATVRESTQSWKLLSLILWAVFTGACPGSELSHMCSKGHLSSSQPDAASVQQLLSCATPPARQRAPQDTWQTSLLQITSGSALRLELCIDSASSDSQKQIQNYHYANWKPLDLN